VTTATLFFSLFIFPLRLRIATISLISIAV
jgi:hypothetical protein